MSNSSPPSPLVRDYARPRSHSSCTTICNENDENDDRPPPGHGAKKTSDVELVKIADGIGMEPVNLAVQPATASDPERVRCDCSRTGRWREQSGDGGVLEDEEMDVAHGFLSRFGMSRSLLRELHRALRGADRADGDTP